MTPAFIQIETNLKKGSSMFSKSTHMQSSSPTLPIHAAILHFYFFCSFQSLLCYINWLYDQYQFWNCGQQLCDLAPFNFAQQNFPLYFKRNRTIDRSSQDSHRKTLAGIWRRGITEDTAVPATTDHEAHCWHSTSPVETTERDNGVINKDYIRKPISVILSSKKLHSMLVL